jgi:prepilin-type N-terminal cleavage/methylation domain-containing protein
MQRQSFVNDKRGFTMAELLVALAMLSIVIGAIYGVFASVNRTCANNEVTAEVMQTMRTSLEFLEQDIRMAGLDRFDSANAGIEVATATNLRFTADRNMDGVINTANLVDGIQEADLERITYAYDAANKLLKQCLSEGTVDDWQIVAKNVDDFQFAYLDADHNPLALPIADLSEIRTVQILLTMEQSAGLAGSVSRTLNKRILCRNLDF